MEGRVFSVKVEWDDEAGVWVVADSEVPGLATEAGTLEGLVERLRVMIPELLEANGVLSANEAAAAGFRIAAERIEHPRAVA